MRVATLHHIADNLAKEVRTKLAWWDTFYPQLQNFNALLGDPERNDRFQWTCLPAYEPNRDKYRQQLKSFSATLYDKRWHEVVHFLKQLGPLLQIFRLFYDPQKYQHGVDPSTGVERERGRADGTEEGSGSNSKFDPTALAETIKSNLFMRYVVFVTKSDEGWRMVCQSGVQVVHAMSHCW